MYDYHTILGGIALVVGIIGYVPYIKHTLEGKTKPHPFTYGIQALVGSISFAAQISANAGPGAWGMGIPVILGIVVTILSLKKGEQPIRKDWYCLAGALAAIVLWRLTSNPLYAVLIVIVINTFAFIPTFRKSYWKPHEETASSYSLGVLRSVISIPALTAFNAVTLLPLIYHILSNVLLVGMLLMRRRSIGVSAASVRDLVEGKKK